MLRQVRRLINLIKLLMSFFDLKIILDDIKINQGIILTNLNYGKKSSNLIDYEFKIFSQWGEDGILQYILSKIQIEHKTFIEFGVGNFTESNCRFLMIKDNWSGFVADGDEKSTLQLKNSYFFWKYDLQVVNSMITQENINSILQQSGFDSDLGVLSIDVNGVDYHLLAAIKYFNPRVIVAEYNSNFGFERKISVPYRKDFDRTKAHFSNLYFGASLQAFNYLLEKRGYSLVGTNSARVNAFFVKKELLNSNLQGVSISDFSEDSKFRESTDLAGRLTYLRGLEKVAIIRGLPVLNVETGKIEKF